MSRTVQYALPAPLAGPTDHAESVLKWTWLGGLLLMGAFLSTAGEGNVFRRGGTHVAGWQFAQLAHGGVIYIPQMYGDLARRVYPMTPLEAWVLALASAISLWMTLGGALTAYAGVHASRPGRWAGIGAAMCLLAGLLGTMSTVLFFVVRGIAFREGAFLWMAAPWLLALGLWRCARRIASAHR